MSVSRLPGSDAVLERAAAPRAGARRRLFAALAKRLPLGGFLRVGARMCTRRDALHVAAYVLLSLGAALAGSLAAICLAMLVRPEGVPVAGDVSAVVRGGVEMQAVAFAVAAGGFAVLRWQAARLGAHLVGRCGVTLRWMVHARLIDAPLGALADSTSAEIANVLTYNVEILVQGFAALLQLAVVGITTAVTLAFAFWMSPPLLLAAPALLGLGLLAARAYGREQSAVSRQYVADMTRLFWLSEDFPRRLRHVRSFERQAAEKASYGAISARLGIGYRRQLELVASGRLALELLAAAGIAGVFVLAQRWHGAGHASLVAVSLLLGRLLPYLTSTRQSFQQLRSAAPAFELWRRHMDLGRDEAPRPPMRAVPAGEALLVECLRLRAPLEALEMRGLVLAPGELVLVSGDSGIGKSSLVDALAGMVEPAAFAARLGGRSIGFGDYRALVRNGAYVGQSVRPWQHTVGECLLWAAPGASAEAMWRALADVGLERRLAASPAGLDTALHDASNRLSGGELQRLLLAQVILRQPFLAVLDEATSALDAASEMAVLAALKRRLPRTVLVVVSHRDGVAALAERRLLIGEDRSVAVADGACAAGAVASVQHPRA